MIKQHDTKLIKLSENLKIKIVIMFLYLYIVIMYEYQNLQMFYTVYKNMKNSLQWLNACGSL